MIIEQKTVEEIFIYLMGKWGGGRQVKKNPEENTDVKCPICKAHMIERRSKWGGTWFGCSKYPSCRGTRKGDGG